MALSDRLAPAMPCYLTKIGHGYEGCNGSAELYVGHKWFDRDIEDGGEFVCHNCKDKDQAVRDAEYVAWCKEMGLSCCDAAMYAAVDTVDVEHDNWCLSS